VKYRVRIDMSFDAEADARAVMDYAKQLSSIAVSINEGAESEEMSFCEVEKCRHDEGLPCETLERVEVGRVQS